jgi:hypothetical protein
MYDLLGAVEVNGELGHMVVTSLPLYHVIEEH